MGQATVDLPDPLQQTVAGSGTSVDDLLSQLAGDEIDRLLSEAENGHAVAASPAAPAPAPAAQEEAPSTPAPAPASTFVAPPAAPLAAPVTPVSAPAAAPAAASKNVDPQVSAQLDDLFALLEGQEVSVPPTPAAVAPTAPAPAPVAATPAAPHAEAPAAPTQQPQTLDQLTAAMLQPKAPAAPAPAAEAQTDEGDVITHLMKDAAIADPTEPAADPTNEAVTEAEAAMVTGVMTDDTDAPTPWYLRPLEWMNAPLDACPENWRELIGKIALVTMFNAVAVLTYVLLFRRHHH